MAIPTRAELDSVLREQLATDPDFRAALLADPRAAVSGLIGVDIPAAVQITVHEESLTDVHLVVPADSDVVADNDLELVAGGIDWSPPCGP